MCHYKCQGPFTLPRHACQLGMGGSEQHFKCGKSLRIPKLIKLPWYAAGTRELLQIHFLQEISQYVSIGASKISLRRWLEEKGDKNCQVEALIGLPFKSQKCQNHKRVTKAALWSDHL